MCEIFCKTHRKIPLRNLCISAALRLGNPQNKGYPVCRDFSNRRAAELQEFTQREYIIPLLAKKKAPCRHTGR